MISLQGIGQMRNRPTLESEGLAIHSSRVSKSGFLTRSLSLSLSVTNTHSQMYAHMENLFTSALFYSEIQRLISSDIHIPRNVSCPVSPIGSPLLHPRSPQHSNGRMSPSPISSPRTTSGSSSPLTSGSGAIPFHHHLNNHSVYLQEFPKSPRSPYVNGTSYLDPNPDIFALGKPAQGETYNGQSVLADCVSHQLLRDHVNLKPSVDLNPRSPSRGLR